MHYINLDMNTDEKFNPINFLNISDFDTYDTVDSYVFTNISNLPLYKQYRVITEEGRPDLISYECYKDTQYWWVILLYNGLTSPTQIKNGMLLGFPTKESLEQLYMSAVLNKKAQ